ncbi:hypothetical protein [Actinospongicola halichondriae]|uniref:hypothetical protein n=1 Tax=Actinospongicola halichondriae TaxID=3236844 RepID=UPI003D4BFD56
MRNPVAGLYEDLLARTDVAPRFTTGAATDTPLRGSQSSTDWAGDEMAWLADHQAAVQVINHIVTDTQVSSEYNLAITHEGTRIDLPVHLVADLDGDRIAALRAYHSTYPLTGAHLIRPPVLTPDAGLEPAPPVDAYEAAMRAGDPAALDALFESDGYVREPAGPSFRHQGAARMAFYRPAFSGGPVRLRLCTIVDDGAALAFEYVCDRWGPADLTPQAGSAVYVRSPAGLLEAVRIYDDVAPPAELFE